MKFNGDTVVCTSYYGDLGGGELRLLEYLKFSSLLRQRCSVVVFERGPVFAQVEGMGIDVVQIPWSLATPRPWKQLQNVTASRRFLRFLRRQQAGLIFCNTYNDFELIYDSCRRMEIPLVLRSRAELFPYFERFSSKRQRTIIERLNEGVSRILTTTEYDRRMMIAAGVQSEKIYTVLQGVDVSVYEDAKENGHKLRQEFGLSEEKTVIGFVARMVPQKGHEIFLEALRTVHDQRPDVCALIVGDAAADGADPEGYRRTLLDRINRLGLSKVVTLTGFRKDIPAVMNAIDIFVHASLKEPFGTVIVESMGTGKPVIASRTLGPQEIIEHGVTGILTPPGNSVTLANAMLQFVNDHELAVSFGSRAKRFVMKNLDLNHTIHSLDHHISEVLQHNVS
jgi:glycosyltransferase involved in cell wall biosynthesis